MKLEGTYRISAPREQVWRALLDPEMMRRILPGCEKLEPAGENRYHASFRSGVGSVKGAFSGEVSMSDVDPPNAYTLRTYMKAGMGFVDGSGRVQLVDGFDPAVPETVITYSGEAKVGGLLASVAGRLIEATAKKNMDEMFANLARQLKVATPPVLDALPRNSQ